ncbi:hypothetical protein A2382_04225 [Candidatus Woesebacteria bacterium RIFOXYB1_FULL_38_16]|uniref:LytR/CpsA/Psr regulator C-terminal domain-containing protein n=2 Tax=Bacteria candidate phyla TaxID=1783234 RepID=A0A1F8CTX2_9BACT|nr:MAG: hypothetical protein A2191_04300 [Candidatus Woesebacteria bacterium RIFOXYA1_FULL_38_9]OGM79777.1 MAG: hypothetical protein A2382_04225 [Candidatus Woesebacteria bacterium RIFOXYB1_FULL_38_16]
MPAKKLKKHKKINRVRTVVEEVTPQQPVFPATPTQSAPLSVSEPQPSPVPETPLNQASVPLPAPEETTPETAPLETKQDIEKKAEQIVAELDDHMHGAETGSSEEIPQKTSFKLIFFVTILTALIVGFVSGGVYVYFTGISSLKQTSPAPTDTNVDLPSPTPSPIPSPTPEASSNLNLKDYEINVLNGSGKIGEASKATALLEKAGFEITSTGNAASYNFKKTSVEVKSDLPKEILSQIEKALSEKYQIELGKNLTESNKYDIVITVGSEST